MADLLYLDASALVKLVIVESESDPLLEELANWPLQVSNVIADVEVHRAARRSGQPPTRASAVLGQLSLLALDEPRRALARSGSTTLRSLDAIHLASSLSLGDDLGGVCCYDRRLAADAEAAGLTVLSSGSV